jgi:hypothetical protein
LHNKQKSTAGCCELAVYFFICFYFEREQNETRKALKILDFFQKYFAEEKIRKSRKKYIKKGRIYCPKVLQKNIHYGIIIKNVELGIYELIHCKMFLLKTDTLNTNFFECEKKDVEKNH